jgi:hypothetical protein
MTCSRPKSPTEAEARLAAARTCGFPSWELLRERAAAARQAAIEAAIANRSRCGG